MTVEQLMNPRYEVIGLWPGMETYLYWKGRILEVGKMGSIEIDYSRFPALFRHLQWWEHRTPEEMPQYIKFIDDHSLFGKEEVYKFRPEEGKNGETLFRIDDIPFLANPNVLPATEEEYNHYRQSIKQQA